MRKTIGWACGVAAVAMLSVAGCKKAPVEAEAPPPAAKGPTSDAPGCDVARAYVTGRLAKFGDKKTAVVDAAPANTAFLPSLKADTFQKKYDPGQENPAGWNSDVPAPALVQAWLAASQASPFTACVDFEKVVQTAGVEMAKVTPGVTPKDKAAVPVTQLNFTVPVANAAGDEALVVESGIVGAGSRVTILVHLRKGKDGAWKETDHWVLEMT